MAECVDGFAGFLMMWAPTLWYAAAFLTLWGGSGAFVFRSMMRTMTSRGWQRLISDDSSSPLGRQMSVLHEDRVIWVFSSWWVLVLSALLGPLGAFPFALIYHTCTRGRVRRWLNDRRAQNQSREPDNAV